MFLKKIVASSLANLSTDKTILATVSSELKSVDRLKIFPEGHTWHIFNNQYPIHSSISCPCISAPYLNTCILYPLFPLTKCSRTTCYSKADHSDLLSPCFRFIYSAMHWRYCGSRRWKPFGIVTVRFDELESRAWKCWNPYAQFEINYC